MLKSTTWLTLNFFVLLTYRKILSLEPSYPIWLIINVFPMSGMDSSFQGVFIPIGQRPIALLDSSKSINIKSISTAATVYLMSTALQNCKINCLYSVLPGKLEVIMLIALINWYKCYVLFHCHNIDHSNNNNR